MSNRVLKTTIKLIIYKRIKLPGENFIGINPVFSVQSSQIFQIETFGRGAAKAFVDLVFRWMCPFEVYFEKQLWGKRAGYVSCRIGFAFGGVFGQKMIFRIAKSHKYLI